MTIDLKELQAIELIKRVSKRYGYTFSTESCLDLLEGSYEGETIADGLTDYLRAYEGVTDDTIRAIYDDEEAQEQL